MWGRTYYSNDINELMRAQSMGIKVIVLDDDAPEYKRLGCIVLSVLLPPFSSIEAELNGDMQSATNLYLQYLSEETCTEAFATICTALYKGKDIMFFVSPDEARNLNYAYTLMNFMYNVFGFPSGSLNYPDSGIIELNPNTQINKFSIMYLMNCIPFEIFCNEYPVDVLPNINCCFKMLTSLQIDPNRFGSQQQVQEFCRRYMDQSIQQFSIARKQNLNTCPMYYDGEKQ